MLKVNNNKLMTMEKKMASALFTVALLGFGVFGACGVKMVEANPYLGVDWVSPPVGTKQPVISILSPHEGSIQNSIDVFFGCRASVGDSNNASYARLMYIYYKPDWAEQDEWVYHRDGGTPYDLNAVREFYFDVNLTDVQEGKHSITVYVTESGAYIEDLYVHMFSINGSSSVDFTIDLSSPNVSVLSPVHMAYESSVIPLNFAVDEQISQAAYCLDGIDNTTISGNTTLVGLADGDHTLTLFAEDIAGNSGKSETTFFSVNTQPTPRPTQQPTPSPTISLSPTPIITLSPSQTLQPTNTSIDPYSLSPKVTVFVEHTHDDEGGLWFSIGVIVLTIVAISTLVVIYLKRSQKHTSHGK